jgi:hypothetical protein
MPENAPSPAVAPLSYRPSAYYFRKELRAAKSVKVAGALVGTLRAELILLSEWIAEQGLKAPSADSLRIAAPTRLVAMRELGLALCRELEAMKAWVREHGLIPPRFNATAAEAEDKWARRNHPVAFRDGTEPG